MPFLEIGSTSIYYEDHGTGIPILFLHGVGGNHASWYQQIPAFRTAYRLITFDARGFGNSIDVDRLGRDGFLNDVCCLLDHLNIGKVILVAQSMGGGAAVSFACTYPDRTQALILADTLVGLEIPEEKAEVMVRIRRDTFDLSQAERVLGVTTRKQNPLQATLYGQIASFNRSNVKTLTGVQKIWEIKDLAKNRLPVLFVCGDEDVLYPPHIIEAVQAKIPGAQLSVIAQAGHSAHFEKPEQFNEIVLGWLKTAIPSVL